MELLLLFIVGIVISEYIEKKSRVGTVVNAIVFIIFGVLIFYGSDNPILMYAAKNTMRIDFYQILHSSLRNPLIFARLGYSTYISIIFILIFISLILSAVLTFQTVKNYFKEKKEQTYEDAKKKKIRFLPSKQEEFINNKFYLVFGKFLS